MQVHDELVLKVKKDALDDVRTGVIERMSKAGELKVELLVEAGNGEDWDAITSAITRVRSFGLH